MIKWSLHLSKKEECKMEIWQLKLFIQVCNDKSFSKAAENLHISQQGLSKTIKNLEAEFGVSLFIRSRNGAKPTEFGNLLFEKSNEVVSKFDIMVDFLYDKVNLKKGKISLGVPHILYTDFFATFISEFQHSYPEIELEIIELGSYLCEKYMEDKLIDISFAVKPVNPEKFEFITISSCNMMLLVNKDNYLAEKSVVKFSDLKKEKFIMLSSEYKSRHLIIECCMEAGFKPDIVFTTTQLALIIELVALNKGIAILPERNSFDALKISDKVFLVPFKDESFKMEVGFIVNRNQNLTCITNAMINYTVDFFENKRSE
jgi:DNA-binding transcriptional LysR family regulator